MEENSVEYWLKKGVDLYLKYKYDEALEILDKALVIEPNSFYVVVNKGIVLNELNRFEEALICFSNASKKHPNNIDVLKGKGRALLGLKHNEESLFYMNKVLKKNHDNSYALSLKGVALLNLKKPKQALKCFNKILGSSPNDLGVINNKGLALMDLNLFEEAIICFDSMPNNLASLQNKGLTFLKMKEYEKAIEAFDKIHKDSPHYLNIKKALNVPKGVALTHLNKYSRAAVCFLKAQLGILNVLNLKELEEKASAVVECMIGRDSFFKEIIGDEINDTEKRRCYKAIYVKSLEIMSLLHVSRNTENQVAHYTRKNTAEELLFNNSIFRLQSILPTNDPKEGKTLIDYLGLNETQTDKDNQAFVGCFSFNPNYLNQFRLYGKENNQEATGISIVVNKGFFSDEMAMLSHSQLTKEKIETEITKEEKTIKKQALYRCIYIDPETNKVVSLGHKEPYVFYREDKEKNKTTNEGAVKAYQEHINTQLEKVQKGLEELKELVGTKGLNPDIVCKLLLNLRYMVKHVAFKEEQECRVISINQVDNENVKVSPDNKQMYVEYLPIKDYTEKVYFAPKATGINLFEGIARHHKLNITCYQCNHPYN